MKQARSGFALIVVVSLLAVLVLAIVALSALTNVNAEIAAAGRSQLQARQHALLALDAAIGELQGSIADHTCTGMAGLTGIPAGAGNAARHWCGVWRDDGVFAGWLASGNCPHQPPPLDDSNSVILAGTGSLGADGVDKEHVRALRVPVRPFGVMEGNSAWWMADEGVKLSAIIPAESSPAPGSTPAIDELIPSLSSTPASLSRVRASAQLALVPPTPLTPGQLQANFHALTVTHSSLAPNGARMAGRLNINTTSARFWRGVAATYNRWRPADAAAISTAAFGDAMRDRLPLADGSAGKPLGGPYATVDAFLHGSALDDAMTIAGGRADEFAAVMRPWLTTRSETFRIRAYGDAVSVADPAKLESVAWCEAIVERIPSAEGEAASRFAVVYFCWLGADDI